MTTKMSDNSYDGEENFDEYEHYNYDQDKAIMSGHSGELLSLGDEVTATSAFQVNRDLRKRPR